MKCFFQMIWQSIDRTEIKTHLCHDMVARNHCANICLVLKIHCHVCLDWQNHKRTKAIFTNHTKSLQITQNHVPFTTVFCWISFILRKPAMETRLIILRSRVKTKGVTTNCYNVTLWNSTRMFPSTGRDGQTLLSKEAQLLYCLQQDLLPVCGNQWTFPCISMLGMWPQSYWCKKQTDQ